MSDSNKGVNKKLLHSSREILHPRGGFQEFDQCKNKKMSILAAFLV